MVNQSIMCKLAQHYGLTLTQLSYLIGGDREKFKKLLREYLNHRSNNQVG